MSSDFSSVEYAVSVAVPGLPHLLSYLLPPSLGESAPGHQVTVEIGRRQAHGWIVEKESVSEALARLNSSAPRESSQLSLLSSAGEKRLKVVISAEPAFSADLLELFRWMSTYYGCSLAEAIDNALPSPGNTRKQSTACLTKSARTMLTSSSDARETLKRRAPVQAAVLERLFEGSESTPLSSLRREIPGADAAVRALQRKGFIEIGELSGSRWERRLDESFSPSAAKKNLTLSQRNATETICAAISSKEFKPYLLFGVTGSGKTEVYMQAIEYALQQGGSALVIVPEIALTPQLIGQFQLRLQTPLAVLHSQVGRGERWEAWQSLLRGEIKVAVGARSAVFAPIQSPSLIIIDEEHEHSYKQSDGLRYHARDLAIMRAKFCSCPAILGSATPSFETLLNVKRSRYSLLELPERATSRPVPSIEIVDLTKHRPSEFPSPNISPLLDSTIRETLEKKEQVVLLYNRRGFASYLQCESCGEVMSCPDCSVTLTYHKGRNLLLCHYCDNRMHPPSCCPYCRDPDTTAPEQNILGESVLSEAKLETIGQLMHRGAGTERLLEELQTLYPTAAIARMDRDTVGAKDSYERILQGMRSGATDILLGTQMVAKGHDLPNVTLVGIIDADVGLHLPDFRSSERAVQLVTQAAGRAGRGEHPGRVLVQTRQPGHPTIVALAAGRFKAFARHEMEQRRKLDYPPWNQLLRVIVSSESLDEAAQGARAVRHIIERLLEKRSGDAPVRLLGPAPAPLERLRRRYRWHILVKAPQKGLLSGIARDLNAWRKANSLGVDVRITVDLDPVEML